MKKQLLLLTVVVLGASVANVEAGFRSSVKELASKAVDKTKALASSTKRGIEAALQTDTVQALQAKLLGLLKEQAKKGLDKGQEYALTYGKELLKKLSKKAFDALKAQALKQLGLSI